jgi:hypothetical protein
MGGTNEDHTELTRAVLMPLDGTTPTSVATNSFTSPAGAALSSDSLVWIDSSESPRVRTASLSPGAAKATIRDVALMRVTSAFDEAIALSTDRHALLGVDGSGSTTTLLSAPKAPVTYADFAIGSDGIATIDDLNEPSHPDSELSVHLRRLTAAGALDNSQRPQLIGAGTHQTSVVTSMLAACGHTVVYATNTQPYNAVAATLHAVRPSGTTVIPDALREGLLQCSRSRVLYCKNSPHPDLPRSGTQAELHIYDLATGLDRFIANVPEPVGGPGGVALSTIHIAALGAGAVAYLEPGGDVVVQNLSTGTKTTVTHVNWQARTQTVSIYLDSNHVLVHAGYGGAGLHDRQAVYTLNRPRRISKLPNHQVAVTLTPAGVITESPPRIDPGGSVSPTSYWLSAWNGALVRLLPEGVYLSAPVIQGNTLAWIDENDELQTRGFTTAE